MVRYCIIRKCSNHTGSVQGASLHSLPRNPLRASWISFIRQENEDAQFEPPKHSTICSLHFDLVFKTVSSNGKVNLSADAYPGPVNSEGNDDIRSFANLKQNWDKLNLTGWYYDPDNQFIFDLGSNKQVCYRIDIKANLMVEIYKNTKFVSSHQIKRFSEVSCFCSKLDLLFKVREVGR